MRQTKAAQARQTTVQPAAAGTPASGPKLLKRRDVEEALGICTTSVRRLDGNTLHPTKGEDGMVRYDPDEVAAVVAARLGSPASRSAKKAEGDLAAEAFDLLSQGVGFREAVTKLREPPRVVRALYGQWRDDGDLWVPHAALVEIRAGIVARFPELEWVRIVTSKPLVDLVHHLLGQIDDNREMLCDRGEEVSELKRLRRSLRDQLQECRLQLPEWAEWAEARESPDPQPTGEGEAIPSAAAPTRTVPTTPYDLPPAAETQAASFSKAR